MLSFAYDRKHRVLRVTVSGVYASQDMDMLDRLLIEFVARHGATRSIFDCTDVEAFAIPESRLIQRAQQPTVMRERVIVASRLVGGEAARAYGRHRREAGGKEAAVVNTLEEAYALLRLKDPRFEPVES